MQILNVILVQKKNSERRTFAALYIDAGRHGMLDITPVWGPIEHIRLADIMILHIVPSNYSAAPCDNVSLLEAYDAG